MANEKDEKSNEKEMEKREEKWERDPLGAVIWALILIWAGVVLLASTTGNLDIFTNLLSALGIKTLELPFDIDIDFFPQAAWSVFFLGAALILILELIIRIIVPSYRRRIVGTAIVAVVFIGLATGNWVLIGPVVLIAIGLSIIIGGLARRK
jgi:hypothetical protein